MLRLCTASTAQHSGWTAAAATAGLSGAQSAVARSTVALRLATPACSPSLLRLPTSSVSVAWHSSEPGWESDGPPVNIVFVTSDGEELPATGNVGMHLLAVAHANKVDLEGACEASLACSTCHVILEDEIFDSLEEPEEEEEDMLDLAFGLTLTSRLGCQVFLTEDMEGMKVHLPAATVNFYVDGHVPQPH